MKKTVHVLLLTLVVIFLAACGLQSVEEFEKMQEEEQSITPPSPSQPEEPNPIEPEPTEQDEVKEPEKEEQPEEQVKEQKTQPETQKEEKPTTEKKQEVIKTPSTKTEQPKANNQTKQPAEKPKEKEVEKTQEPVPQKRTVTIAIRVDTLLQHWDLLDPALQSEKYVPKSGVILKPTTYELLSENDTVWDILQRATKEHKIQMEYQGANENIYSSVYIEGINHLYEFSAGELSGWMYNVNGVYPNYGCSQYVLQDGDVIEWHYTVDLGRDLGHYWAGE